MGEAWWRTQRVRLTTRRYRQVLIALLVTVFTSATCLGLISIVRWRGHQALTSDTQSIVAQTSEQLIRALKSRRGTLTFIRDTLNRQPDVATPHLQAIGASATQHTRHLLAVGLIRQDAFPVWWDGPRGFSRREQAYLNQAILRRTRLAGIWRVPSTFATQHTSRPLLIMFEPLRHPSLQRHAIVGAFDLKPLLADFFASGLAQRYPVQIIDNGSVLYRSRDWQPPAEGEGPVVVERPLSVDAVRWTVQMQPGASGIVQTLSWVNLLLIGLSAIAGLGVTTIVWLLAARTWILQRAVARRTQALRRTLGRLRQLATTDELTGLHNRRFFLSRWVWECDRAKRYQRPLACLMIDLNGFKQVNDRLGHRAGDFVLQQVAKELKAVMRQSDILARFGGDEFIVALPETSSERARTVAQKLRQLTIPVPATRGRSVEPVSLSVGVGYLSQDERPEDIIQAADQSLYTSKRHAKVLPADQPAGDERHTVSSGAPPVPR